MLPDDPATPLTLQGHALSRAILVVEVQSAETQAAGRPVEIAGFAVIAVLSVVYPAEAELESLVVDARFRRRGLGRALLEAVRSFAAGNGADTLRLEVRRSNGAARQLYEAAGLQRSGIRRAYYANPTEDAICMEWKLSPEGIKDPLA